MYNSQLITSALSVSIAQSLVLNRVHFDQTEIFWLVRVMKVIRGRLRRTSELSQVIERHRDCRNRFNACVLVAISC